MKHQIIKVESYVLWDSNSWIELGLHNCFKFPNHMKIKQISYQYFDFEKNEWVVLPTPKQPKIEGISFNEEEGVDNNE